MQEVLGLCADPFGPTFLNRCRAEKKHTNEYRQMVKIILKIEEEREPCRNAKGWKVEGEKRGVTKTQECRMLREEFEVGVFKLQNGVWNFAERRMLED